MVTLILANLTFYWPSLVHAADELTDLHAIGQLK